mmetsp:Transcript_6773/g.25311  ORF Transcript_6773/g.25311 Transcript_6773/m.25311 type:complete len:111 (-) Transcript_6773:510-842(-)
MGRGGCEWGDMVMWVDTWHSRSRTQSSKSPESATESSTQTVCTLGRQVNTSQYVTHSIFISNMLDISFNDNKSASPVATREPKSYQIDCRKWRKIVHMAQEAQLQNIAQS